MERSTIAIGTVLMMGLGAVAAVRTGPLMAGPAAVASSSGTRVRFGVYDSRAIAVAWALSRHNPVAEKRAALEAAKKAGDLKKVQELEAWGPAKQRLLHFQGFGRVPVDDLLAPVKGGVARVAREKGLAAIAMSCNYTAPNTEVVDVTNALVELYAPTDRTRATVKSLRQVEPVGLLELADMKATD